MSRRKKALKDGDLHDLVNLVGTEQLGIYNVQAVSIALG